MVINMLFYVIFLLGGMIFGLFFMLIAGSQNRVWKVIFYSTLSLFCLILQHLVDSSLNTLDAIEGGRKVPNGIDWKWRFIAFGYWFLWTISIISRIQKERQKSFSKK